MNQLVPAELYAESATFHQLLESLDAVEIMEHLEVTLITCAVSLRELITLGRVNMLCLLIHDRVGELGIPYMYAMVTSPEIVNVKKLLGCALKSDSVDMVQVLHRHLSKELVNTAISNKTLNILRWVYSLEFGIQLINGCVSNKRVWEDANMRTFFILLIH
jgi:hypothetical protein